MTAVTLWVMLAGYRIATGQSCESALATMVKATKIVVIARVVGTNGAMLHKIMTDNLGQRSTNCLPAIPVPAPPMPSTKTWLIPSSPWPLWTWSGSAPPTFRTKPSSEAFRLTYWKQHLLDDKPR